jgi:recombination protein RecA
VAKVKSPLDKLTALRDTVSNINKKYGKDGEVLKFASDVNYAHLHRIPTGIFNLDMALGGGVPKGRIIMVVGEEASGKSTFALELTGRLQHTCKQCMEPFKGYTDEQRDGDGDVAAREYIVLESCPCGENDGHMVNYNDFEGHFDPIWAAAHGVDVPSLLLTQPQTAEMGVDATNVLVRTGQLDAVIVDSIAMMTPSREVEKSAEDGQRPDMALIVNRFMRTLQASLNSLGLDNPNKPIVVLINQFREKVGVMYGDPRTWPGGKGQNFAASIILSFRQGKAIDGKNNVGGKDDEKIGAEFFFRTEKNKTFAPYKKGAFKMYNTDVPALGIRKGEINNFEQMVAYAETLGLLAKSGAWYDLQPAFGPEFANPESGKGTFNGLSAVYAFLAQHPDKAKVVRERILAAVKANDRAVPSTDDSDAA